MVNRRRILSSSGEVRTFLPPPFLGLNFLPRLCCCLSSCSVQRKVGADYSTSKHGVSMNEKANLPPHPTPVSCLWASQPSLPLNLVSKNHSQQKAVSHLTRMTKNSTLFLESTTRGKAHSKWKTHSFLMEAHIPAGASEHQYPECAVKALMTEQSGCGHPHHPQIHIKAKGGGPPTHPHGNTPGWADIGSGPPVAQPRMP